MIRKQKPPSDETKVCVALRKPLVTTINTIAAAKNTTFKGIVEETLTLFASQNPQYVPKALQESAANSN